jgi:hypothetical protein
MYTDYVHRLLFFKNPVTLLEDSTQMDSVFSIDFLKECPGFLKEKPCMENS